MCLCAILLLLLLLDGRRRRQVGSVLYLPGLSRYFDCFDSIMEWDGMSGMEVVFDPLIFLAVLRHRYGYFATQIWIVISITHNHSEPPAICHLAI